MITDKYTVEQVIEMYNTWKNFNGFDGVTCQSCKITANILSGFLSWECSSCQEINFFSLDSRSKPFENPDVGTPLSVIREGFRKSKLFSRYYSHLFSDESDS